MDGNVYQELTKAFNTGRLRAILSSGQAVVMHRLAVMSKDGDWILREDDETPEYVLTHLENRGAHYRFGAPLDLRWLSGGWSSHFEFHTEKLRVRTDFVSRPPRITPQALAAMWLDAETSRKPIPFTDVATLVEMKKTNRERDYAVIGELARLLENPTDSLLQSRSARDLMALARDYPERLDDLLSRRPLLKHVHDGLGVLEAALDAERRQLIHANERRLQVYKDAAKNWIDAWPALHAEVSTLPLREAHAVLVASAGSLLPFQVEGS